MCFLFGCNGFVNPYSTYCTYITLLISLDFKTKEKKKHPQNTTEPLGCVSSPKCGVAMVGYRPWFLKSAINFKNLWMQNGHIWNEQGYSNFDTQIYSRRCLTGKIELPVERLKGKK